MNLDTYARGSEFEYEFDQDGALRFGVVRERLYTTSIKTYRQTALKSSTNSAGASVLCHLRLLLRRVSASLPPCLFAYDNARDGVR